MQNEWFSSWFNTPYYHILYKHRDYSEASLFIDNICDYLKIDEDAVCWDLCCGKGRHSMYLNQKGYRVIGTDLSEASIQEANKHSSLSLEFYTHDMRSVFRTNYFDVVFNLFTSFGYFDKEIDDLNVFKSVFKSLKPNGIFVFDFLNAAYVSKHLVTFEEKIIDGITFQISKTIENNTIIKQIKFSDKNVNYQFEERVKAFSKNYFKKLADECGFKIIHEFGNYQLESFDEQSSPRLILTMQKQ